MKSMSRPADNLSLGQQVERHTMVEIYLILEKIHMIIFQWEEKVLGQNLD
jgi:hypothetical protein